MLKDLSIPYAQGILHMVTQNTPINSSDRDNTTQSKIATLKKHKKPISIRVRESDLAIMKIKALAQGIPYQTYINTLIHNDALALSKQDICIRS